MLPLGRVLLGNHYWAERCQRDIGYLRPVDSGELADAMEKVCFRSGVVGKMWAAKQVQPNQMHKDAIYLAF